MSKKYPLVYVEWCDAMSDSAGWMNHDDAVKWADNEDWVIHQSGFLVKETKEYIFMASRINPQADTVMKMDGLFKIPKTWIRKKVRLTV